MTHKILHLVLFVALIHAISGAPQAPRQDLTPPNSTDKSSKTPVTGETSSTTLTGSTTEKLRVARAATDDAKKATTTVKTLADAPNPAVVNKDNTDTTASSTPKGIIRNARGTEEHSDDDDEEEEDNSTSSYTKIPSKHEDSSEEDSEENTDEESEEDALPTKESEYEKHHEHERYSRQVGKTDSPKSSENSTATQQPVTTVIIDTTNL